MPPIPSRIVRALDLLAPNATDRLLEVGCGPGKAALHLAATRTFAHLLAIDRSATAIQAAKAALPREHRDRVAFRLANLAAFDPGKTRFDRIFAINVNLFWLEAAREMPVVAKALRPGGRLLLFYTPPVAAKMRRMVDGVATQIEGSGLAIEDVLREGGQAAPFLAIAIRAGVAPGGKRPPPRQPM